MTELQPPTSSSLKTILLVEGFDMKHPHLHQRFRTGPIFSSSLPPSPVPKQSCQPWKLQETLPLMAGNPKRAPYYVLGLFEPPSTKSLADKKTCQETLLSILPEILKNSYTWLQPPHRYSPPLVMLDEKISRIHSYLYPWRSRKCLIVSFSPYKPAIACQLSSQHKDAAEDIPDCT